MSCSRHIEFTSIFIPSDHQKCHEHIRFYSWFKNFICFCKNKCRVIYHFWKTGNKGIYDHHNESRGNSMPRNITNIDICIWALLYDIIVVSTYFGCTFCIRHYLKCRNFWIFLLKHMFLDIRSQLYLWSKNSSWFEFFFKVPQYIKTSVKKVPNIGKIGIKPICLLKCCIFTSCKKLSDFSSQLSDWLYITYPRNKVTYYREEENRDRKSFWVK